MRGCDIQIVCINEVTCFAVYVLIVSIDLNSIGERTLPWGKPFLWFLHLLRSFSITYNLLLGSIFRMTAEVTVLCGFMYVFDQDLMVYCIVRR